MNVDHLASSLGSWAVVGLVVEPAAVLVAVLVAVRHSTIRLADRAELAYQGPLE